MFRSTGRTHLAAIAIAMVLFQQGPTAAADSTTSTPTAAARSAAAPLGTDHIWMAATANVGPLSSETALDVEIVADATPKAIDIGVEAAPVPSESAEEAAVDPEPVAEPIVEPVAQPAAFSCGGGAFCYPRLGISAPLVAYSDCTGKTDLGQSIRLHTCLPATYVVAHAYTQFGRIWDWQQGDVVIVNGTRFTITGAIRQAGCTALSQPQAPLSLQTSLTSTHCGPILIVQGR